MIPFLVVGIIDKYEDDDDQDGQSLDDQRIVMADSVEDAAIKYKAHMESKSVPGGVQFTVRNATVKETVL